MKSKIKKLIYSLFIAAIFYWILPIIFSLIQGRVEAYLAKGDR